MGFGALGDEGDSRERSYVFLPIPEWLLDSSTACVEVSRSADLPDGLLDDQLSEAGFAATGANQLDFGCTAVVDLLRLTMGSKNLQVPITELLLTISMGHYSRKNQGSSTPGFLWRHAQERWELPEAHSGTLDDLWKSSIEGPNAEAVRWPLRRFGVAKQRSFAEDRLVDPAIASEAIFVQPTDSYRNTSALIAERTNRFLGGNRTAQRLRSSQVLSAYAIRSDIVHGRLPPEADVERAASAMESVLRESLRILLAATDYVDPAEKGLGFRSGFRQVNPRPGVPGVPTQRRTTIR